MTGVDLPTSTQNPGIKFIRQQYVSNRSSYYQYCYNILINTHGLRMHKQHLLIGAKILIALSLLIYLLQDANLGDIFQTFRGANIPVLAFAFSLYVIGYLITGFRLHLLISVYGMCVPVKSLIQSFMIATFFNNFLPSTVGGDLSRAYDLWRYCSSKSRAITSILIDRFLGLFALLLFTVVSVLFTKEVIFPESIVYIWVAGGALSSMLIVYLVFFTPGWVVAIASHYSGSFTHPFIDKIKNLLAALYSFRGKRRILFYAMVLSIALQANVVIQYFIVAQAIAIDIPLHAFFIIIPLTIFIMMVPVSINAIGIREGAFVFFFAFYGISNSEAIAYAWIMYAFVLMQGILGAVVFVVRRKNEARVM